MAIKKYLIHTHQNTRRRRALLCDLEDTINAHLEQGHFVRITIEAAVHNGTLTDDHSVTVKQLKKDRDD